MSILKPCVPTFPLGPPPYVTELPNALSETWYKLLKGEKLVSPPFSDIYLYVY